MKTKRIAGLFACMLSMSCLTQAQIGLPAIFSDGMVLQQKSEVAVWGWSSAGSTVQVVGSWAPNDTAKVKVDLLGRWKTTLKTADAGGPYTLWVSGKGTKTVNDVMLGEVWLCSGQSNMEWTPMHGLDNRDEEIANSNHPNIRFFNVPMRGSDLPQNNCQGIWEASSPEVMKQRSSVAYFFGRKLQKELNVPIGLVVSAWGGTSAEVWTPYEAMLRDKELAKHIEQPASPWWPVGTGQLYNQMIHPITPYSLSGCIWYQGESNQERASSYSLLLKTMIESWRTSFQKEFPFYLVQIAPFTYNTTDNGPARIREAQEWITRNVPHTGMVVVSDLVSDVKNIHPTDKQNVGIRLGNLALGELYNGTKTGIYSPLYETMTVEKNRAILSFLHADKGLTCKDKLVNGLMIAGADGIFVEAKGQIKGSQLIVTSPKVKVPTAVRYSFDDATIGNLFSAEGLPVAPFRTDKECKE